MIWCNANRYLPCLEPFPRKSCHWFINWIPSQCIGSIPRITFVLSPTLSSLWIFISLDLMLLLGKTKNPIFTFKACVKIKQESHAQLSSLVNLVNLCFSCAMSLPWTTPCWLLTLWLPLLAIPPLHSACSYDPICATWNFTLGVWSIMVLWVATTVPRWNRGHPVDRGHKVVLLGMHWYRVG